MRLEVGFLNACAACFLAADVLCKFSAGCTATQDTVSANVWVRVHPHICVLKCLGHFAIACWAHWAFGCFGAGLRIFAISFATSMLGRLMSE